MRPHDIAILLKLVSLNGNSWQLSTLANDTHISLSEISESLNRSKVAGLLNSDKKQINRQNLMEFIEHGIRYVFPQQPGALVRGMPTAHSHPFMKKMFPGQMEFVWPNDKGKVIGQMIEPFYPKQSEAVNKDEKYYKLLSLVDVIRVGKSREIKYALAELKKDILDGLPN